MTKETRKSFGRLEFKNVSKSYKNIPALNSVSFEVPAGEFFSLVGPSGCGKTTLLKLIAGFETPDSGEILLDGVNITALPPHERSVNTVFQSYALFPHLTLFENIAFGLRVKKKPEAFIQEEVAKMFKLIQMEGLDKKYPDELSGGQKQRVAIARALINKPKVLLLDEPFSALDLKLKQKMLFDIDQMHDDVGITFLFVTHDQTEAMAVSDHIAVLNKGKIEQIGSPIEIYEAPKSSFVAAFIGDTNFLEGVVVQTVANEYSLLSFDNLPPILCFNDKQIKEKEKVHLSVRPEKILISREEPLTDPLKNKLQGIVKEIVYKGDRTSYYVQVGSHLFLVSKQHHRFFLDEQPIKWEESVWIFWHADDGYILEG